MKRNRFHVTSHFARSFAPWALFGSVLFVSYYSRVKTFGLYDDDYYYIAVGINSGIWDFLQQIPGIFQRFGHGMSKADSNVKTTYEDIAENFSPTLDPCRLTVLDGDLDNFEIIDPGSFSPLLKCQHEKTFLAPVKDWRQREVGREFGIP